MRIGDHRHLLFATARQLELLETAATWYVDFTFKIVRQPFTQLLSFHAFVKYDGYMKQVPLAFYLMSRRTKKDYKEVFRAILSSLPETPSVTTVLTDFEAAVWQGLRSAIPRVAVKGCTFHWSQAVYRKVQQLGLQTAYSHEPSIFNLIRRILALSFLPAEKVLTQFERLRDTVQQPQLVELMDYVYDTWMSAPV